MFIRGRKSGCSLRFLTRSFYSTPKIIRQYTRYFAILKISGGRDLNMPLRDIAVMNIGALPRRCHPKVTRIGTHGLLHSRSAMPWRLTRDLISVVSRTELRARESSVPSKCETAHVGNARVMRPCKAMCPRAPNFLPGKCRRGHDLFTCQ